MSDNWRARQATLNQRGGLLGSKSIGGVEFLVNKNIKDRVVEFRGDSSRVASLTIKINTKYYLQVVQDYAPTSTHEDEEVEEFYEVSKIMSENKS